MFRRPDKNRPVLLLTRNEVINELNEIIVVPATRTIRELPSEVILTQQDGMPSVCALNFHHITIAERTRLGSVIASLPEYRWPDVERALLFACGFEVDMIG